MKKATYFAIFEPSDTGYSIYFPDFPGCITCGDNIEHGLKMAKEALGLHYWGMERDGDEIPNPTAPPFLDMQSNDFVVPVDIFPDIIKGAMENRAIKKTLTIPYWLNKQAEAQSVNFSQVLQSALKEYLQIEIDHGSAF